MNDIPYTTPEEDPFSIRPIFREVPRRRSSLFDKWIEEQQKPPDKEPPPPSQNKAYLTVVNPSKDDIVTLDNYDIVDDDDIPATLDAQEPFATPSTTRSRRTSKLPHSSGSFCTFKPFRSSATPSLPDGSGSPRSSRFSFLPLTPRHSMDVNMVKSRSTTHQHTRSSSLGAFGFSVSGNSGVATITPLTRSRPSILGHFASLSTSEASVPSAYTPSRPSISSGDTFTSGTPTTESDLPLTPSRLNFMDSIRFRTKSSGGVFASASAIFSSGSLPTKQTGSSEDRDGNLVVAINDADTLPTDTITQRSQSTRIPLAQKPTLILTNVSPAGDEDEGDDTYHATKQPVRQTDLTRPHVAYSSGSSLPRVRLATFSTRHKKKKKLVVRGIGPNEVRKFEGVKQWCESFGEVSQIVRMPNDDLHVHFRLAEVADTVCRLRARVYITGVGSVQLSWLTG